MALLAGVLYDPSTAVAKSTATLLAMTAFDTTNLRLTFTTPTNGSVLVRIRTTVTGQNQSPQILLGVLEGTTVIARQTPIGALNGTAVATTRIGQEVLFTVTGLSAGSHTWDAAYAVQLILTGTNIQYGGPNDTTANNAWGGISFEIYDAPNLLAAKLYDPTTQTSVLTTAASVMTALDTTNLRLTFTAPATGNVLVRLRGAFGGTTTYPQVMLGVLSGATVIGRGTPTGGLVTAANAAGDLTQECEFIVKGLSGSQTWDAAMAVETGVTGSALKFGGANDALGNDAWGGFLFEVWSL